MKKRALAVVSFGTTSPQARRAIENMEKSLASRMPDCDLFRAFTSNRIIARLHREQSLSVPTPEQLMNTLLQQGYQEVICQPLHILNGWEYEKMCRQIAPAAQRFERFTLGKPMLTDFSDYQACCRIIAQNTPIPQEGEALVLMGHGSDHFSNAAYSQLENVMEYLGMERVFVGTVEGFPNLDFLCTRLKKQEMKTVTLMPLLMVAGEHARTDMAGLWKSRLEQQGYSVRVCMKGLGEFPETADLFFRHVKEAQPFPYG